MKRRLACIVLAALLLLGLCCTAFAEAPAATEAQLWNITDTVGLLTSDEDLTLEARAEEISAQYGVGIYLLILEDYSEYYDDPYETAYELYHQNTLGMGEDRDGVILLMSMSDRKYATFFYGPKAEYAFDAYGQELMEEDGVHLQDGTAYDDQNGASRIISRSATNIWPEPRRATPSAEIILRRAAPTAAASGRRFLSAWASPQSSQ